MSKYTTDYSKCILPEMPVQWLDELGKEIHWGYPLQISGGVIDPSGVHSDLFNLEIKTHKGPWNIHGILKSQVDEDEISGFLDDLKRRHRMSPLRWSNPRRLAVVPI